MYQNKSKSFFYSIFKRFLKLLVFFGRFAVSLMEKIRQRLCIKRISVLLFYLGFFLSLFFFNVSHIDRGFLRAFGFSSFLLENLAGFIASDSSYSSSSALLYAPGRHNNVIVIDAGSTGTRAHIINYTYSENECNGRGATTVFLPDIHKKVYPGIAVLAQEYEEEEKERKESEIAINERAEVRKKRKKNNADAIDKKLEDYLNVLRDFAYAEISEGDRRNTVILFKGTAGIRYLSSDLQKLLMEKVRNIIKGWDFIYEEEYSVEVLSGTKESIYGWIVLNQILGNFPESESFLRIEGKDERGERNFSNSSRPTNEANLFTRIFYYVRDFIKISNQHFRYAHHDSFASEKYNPPYDAFNNTHSYTDIFILNTKYCSYFLKTIYNYVSYYFIYMRFFLLRLYNKFFDFYFPQFSIHSKVGIVEMGGASAQIVFEPPADLLLESKNEKPKEENSAKTNSTSANFMEEFIHENKQNSDFVNLSFCKSDYVLYAKSFMGMGRQLALQSLINRLVDNSQILNSNYNNKTLTDNANEQDNKNVEKEHHKLIQDNKFVNELSISCLHLDTRIPIPLRKNIIDENLMFSELKKNDFVAKGNSNFLQCRQDIRDSFTASGVKPIPFNISSNYKIYLLENYYHFNEYVVMNDRGRHIMCANDFLETAKNFCKMNSSEVKNLIHPSAANEKSVTSCFGLIFMSEFLISILHINPDELLHAIAEINNVDISWAAAAPLVELPIILNRKKKNKFRKVEDVINLALKNVNEEL